MQSISVFSYHDDFSKQSFSKCVITLSWWGIAYLNDPDIYIYMLAGGFILLVVVSEIRQVEG